MNTKIISVGGSIVIPDFFDIDFLNTFKEFPPSHPSVSVKLAEAGSKMLQMQETVYINYDDR